MRKTLKMSLFVSVGLLTFGMVGLTGCGENTTIAAATVNLDATTLSLEVGKVSHINAFIRKRKNN